MHAAIRGLAKLKNAMETFAREHAGRRRLASYLKSDRRPWRTGYYEYRVQYLSNVINDDGILETFRQGHPLPDGYGFRLDARVVEIPWVVARLAWRTGLLLDAGSSLNHEFVLRAPALANKRIKIVTLAPESRRYWKLAISYVFGDLRDLDFRVGRFDSIACISTIQHVGMNNTMYTGSADMAQPADTKAFLLAVKELGGCSNQVVCFTSPFLLDSTRIMSGFSSLTLI